ncbi:MULTISPECIES: aminotransferase class V-fold PLP-dependent enzyme [unclassified Ruegeria]|uniref:aminotransferase class V-fold PLP-dependent enzyme n=1 Tax=unclassified Ruegeria TaxID=2625375 RepID=UPI001487F32B|nr:MULTISPECIES: aminotransferase class V-fold PLP-dependent enzyme [unclassified Ruegeria]NOD62325.1 aminotransferase class V-fold PLP-dependent enzyme [Ruegeria sp. HKCCD6109]
MTLSKFRADLCSTTHNSNLRDGLIGENVLIPGLLGDVPLVYADYVASGRALRQVEDYVAQHVLPFYANSHTEASYCGSYMTRLRREARNEIARLIGARGEDAVIFTGSGATAGLNRLVSLMGVEEADQPVVLIGPYEHHSNILPWRESKAQVIEIPEDESGGVDLQALESALEAHADADLLIGSFSAASNVTGIITDPDPVTRVLKAHGALAVWDYAGGGPYLPMDMGPADARKDAIVVSPHKFPGGPGASGVLVVNQTAVQRDCPSWPGGGTVSFVSPWRHDYSADLSTREEAGTPNVIGDIRAALAFIVKDVVGTKEIAEREAQFNRMALEGWQDNPHLTLLGVDNPHRLPIFSFLVRDNAGQPVHQQLFTRMLSDIYGIQARGGCACAGPYAHRLLGIDRKASEALHAALSAGEEMKKPGWVRLNFSYLMSEETVQFIVDSVNDLSRRTEEFAPHYDADPATARFKAA